MYKKHFLSFCALFFTFCHNGIANTLKINRLIKKLNCIFFILTQRFFWLILQKLLSAAYTAAEHHFNAMTTTYLQVENLSKAFGDKVLFEGISFSIMKDQKTALIAKNGTGKSTLLDIIGQKTYADSGSVVFRNDLTIGYLQQDPVLDNSLTVRQQILAVNNKLARISADYEEALASGDHDRIAAAQAAMDASGAWTTRRRCAKSSANSTSTTSTK